MKILVLGSSDDYLDDAIDAFSNAGVGTVGKVLSGGLSEFCSAVEDAIIKKGYDIVIGSSSDYIAAGIELNRHTQIRAAVINSKQDINAASKNRINVFLISGDSSIIKELAKTVNIVKNLPEVHDTKGGRKTLATFTESVKKKQQTDDRSVHGNGNTAYKPSALKERSAESTAANSKYPEDDVNEAKEHGGLISRLKNSLGIMDGENQTGKE
jgi:ribose 5-phosphate isomerase RpiB